MPLIFAVYKPKCTHVLGLYCRSLPHVTDPEVFGFHNNANITKEQNETFAMMNDMMLTQGSAAKTKGKSEEEAVGSVASDILARMPEPWNVAAVQKK